MRHDCDVDVLLLLLLLPIAHSRGAHVTAPIVGGHGTGRRADEEVSDSGTAAPQFPTAPVPHTSYYEGSREQQKRSSSGGTWLHRADEALTSSFATLERPGTRLDCSLLSHRTLCLAQEAQRGRAVQMLSSN